MVKIIYLGLLAFIALTSAQESGPGECDPVAHAEIIEGCESACGSSTTCKNPLNGKPYCSCEVPPKPDTSDEKYECVKLIEGLEQMLPSDQPPYGYECKGRCPEDQGLVTYACDKQDDGSDTPVCVCSTPRFQSQGSQSQGQGMMRGLVGGAIADVDFDTLLDNLGQALGDLADDVFSVLSGVLKGAVNSLVSTLKLVLNNVKSIVVGLGV